MSIWHAKTPRQEGESCRGDGWDYLLVEAEAGDVGFFDDVGIVTLGLVEGEGEVLDAVLGAELHEEVGELSQFGAEPFTSLVDVTSPSNSTLLGRWEAPPAVVRITSD